MTPHLDVLILSGTLEGRKLAERLVAGGDLAVESSFAGRTARPVAPAGALRVGGFGGPAGLAAYLRTRGVRALVDATHPHAPRITANAVVACAEAGTPRLRLARPTWQAGAADRWTEVADLAAAARHVARSRAKRPFLTIGRQDLAAFADLTEIDFLVRSVDPPDPMPLARATFLAARGPFVEADELALLRAERVDLLVTKNSGGEAAEAKLAAARTLGIPVVMVAPPPEPDGPLARTIEDAVAWVRATLAHTGS
jgi:precorrin-6A/cobalt-precorrin-6A reductase